MTLLRVGLVLAAAVAAAAVANLVLLGVATGSGERVGNLSPNAAVISTPASAPVTTTPVKPVAPRGESRDREHDD
jgi:hypothetical protein